MALRARLDEEVVQMANFSQRKMFSIAPEKAPTQACDQDQKLAWKRIWCLLDDSVCHRVGP